ncbi:class I SAM-dependent methyltransferase [Natranaeroarchaeum aerophilus]|uniref:Methyltransferase domain-containing protein n=1 Tax=Natranaeroarchaeum aerophilus TaxID=2917711 RepID=A0AAE3K456_9EURY|nr:methyltransferase domain-containing protein [Natranaeroarchaeum aerophilus]MCL9813177.1 methyltransferase domain-containing protein [Natranaeroarchaeum aerophilus]
MTGSSDVRHFDIFAGFYDLFMPKADPDVLSRGLALAEHEGTTGLDVGGGTGRAARAIPDMDWTVVDASGGMLAEAAAAGIPGVRGDAARLPVVDESVEAVTIVDALHHIGRSREAIAEAVRVLAPGGVLVIREFDPTTIRGRALVAGEHLIGFDSTFFGPDELAGMLDDAGLQVSVPERGFGYTVAGVKPQ